MLDAEIAPFFDQALEPLVHCDLLANLRDGGQTFSPPVRINDDPSGNNAWQWFGTLSVAPNGRIDVVWNDTRNTESLNLSELYYSFSTDGGETWSVNERLSEVWNSFVGWPGGFRKIGDYYHMVSDNVGAHLAWANTLNGQQDVYYLRIGDDDCNSNGVGDSQELAAGTSLDVNDNGIPDECEPDCNGNGVLDSAEIAGRISLDGDVDRGRLCRQCGWA